MLSYLSMHEDGSREVARASKIERNTRELTTEHQDLLRVLRNATMNDRTVILTTLNEAWAKPNSVLDLFFESFHIGEQTEQLLNHLVILAMDPKAFERCKSVHPHCYFLTTEGVDFTGEKRYMSQDYVKMVWRRLEFFRIILELGYNFLFTVAQFFHSFALNSQFLIINNLLSNMDMDVMWLRNPFSHFSSNADITFSTDGFNGDPTDINNWPNNGFLYVRSCDQTIEFYKYWCLAKSLYPGDNEQTVLNKIKRYNVARINHRIRFLDTAYFGGFCQPSKDFNKVCTMHANCCIGIDNKLHDLKIVLADWKNYTSRTAEERERGGFSWRIPDKCIIKNLKRSTAKS
ncbi:Glycosyltransferase [Cocos nucifera]|uniref:Glycosyltransferase n=1 Tax=Cocos nucifera TaxID=13894 RepID=A0A8K0HZ92_COCNU|nr:Glycosyltransferase [Cocos nucifera]